MFVVYVAFTYFCTAVGKERTASLVVLPPLVLGYDELYEDQASKETGNEKLHHHTDEKEHHTDGEKKENHNNGEKLHQTDDGIVDIDDNSNDKIEPTADNDFLEDDPPNDEKRHEIGNNNCNPDMREVEIVGKMVIPRNMLC